MTGLDEVRRLVDLDHGLTVVATTRANGAVQATVVNAGVIDHPITGDPVCAFVVRENTRKLRHLRARPEVTLVWRAGWAWTTVEGRAELAGPDDPVDGIDDERLRLLLREVFQAAGGVHEDWAEYDRVVAAERRAAVLVHPDRIYTNP